MSEDWLDTSERVPALPIPVELPVEYGARLALVEQCMRRLSGQQIQFLNAIRDSGFNVRRAVRAAPGLASTRAHSDWMHLPEYSTVFRVWRGGAAVDAQDRDRLLARQDDIVETLLEPKPRFHQGIAMIGPNGKPYEEVEAGAASKANETLMRAAGLLKDREIEINVGILNGPPTLNIQVMPTPPSAAVRNETVAIDAKFTEVPDDEWLGT